MAWSDNLESKEEFKTANTCTNHPSQTADYLCKDCGIQLCIRCKNDHLKNYSTHQVILYKEQATILMDEVIEQINKVELNYNEDSEEMEQEKMIIDWSEAKEKMRNMEKEQRFVELYMYAKETKDKLAKPEQETNKEIKEEDKTSMLEEAKEVALTQKLQATEALLPEKQYENYHPVFSCYEKNDIFNPLENDEEISVIEQLWRADWRQYKFIYINGARYVSDLTAKLVANVLLSHSNITGIYLGGDKITDEGAKAMSKVIRVHNSLRGLYFCNFLLMHNVRRIFRV